MTEDLDPCVKAVVNKGAKTYYCVKEIPRYEGSDPDEPGCTMCVAKDNDNLCHSMPSCGSSGHVYIYIEPKDLQQYKIAYTIARVSS